MSARLEEQTGHIVMDCEFQGSAYMNPLADQLVMKWHIDRAHVLTTNYDTIVERLAQQQEIDAANGVKPISSQQLYPVPIATALSRFGTAVFAPSEIETFTLYKLHGSAAWYRSDSEATFDPIYELLEQRKVVSSKSNRLVVDKRRFIVPPVFDKSSLLNQETMRSIWRQALNALLMADTIFVVGYSLPETDRARQTLLWEGSSGIGTIGNPFTGEKGNKKEHYVIDVNLELVEHYERLLGKYYDVRNDYVGPDRPFDRFVRDYVPTNLR